MDPSDFLFGLNHQLSPDSNGRRPTSAADTPTGLHNGLDVAFTSELHAGTGGAGAGAGADDELMRAGVPNLADQLALWTNANFSFDGPTGHALLGDEEKDKDKDEDAPKESRNPKSFGFNNPNHRLEEASGRPLGGPAQPLPGPSRHYAPGSGPAGSGAGSTNPSNLNSNNTNDATPNNRDQHSQPPSHLQSPTATNAAGSSASAQQGPTAATSQPPPPPGGFPGLGGFGGLPGLGGAHLPGLAALGSLPFLQNGGSGQNLAPGSAGPALPGTSPPTLDMTSILALQHLLTSNPLALAQLSSSLTGINPLLAQMQLAQAHQQQQQQHQHGQHPPAPPTSHPGQTHPPTASGGPSPPNGPANPYANWQGMPGQAGSSTDPGHGGPAGGSQIPSPPNGFSGMPPPGGFWQQNLQPGSRFPSFSGPGGGFGSDVPGGGPGGIPAHNPQLGAGFPSHPGGGPGLPFFPGPGDMAGAAAHINGQGHDSNLGDDEDDNPLPPKRKRGSRAATTNGNGASATEGMGAHSNAADSDSAGPSGLESALSGTERARALDVPPLKLIDTGNPEADAEANRVLIEEDKRKRNTAASARFRIKKKQREQALESSAKEMTARIRELEQENTRLRTENGWLKSLIQVRPDSNAAQTDDGSAAGPSGTTGASAGVSNGSAGAAGADGSGASGSKGAAKDARPNLPNRYSGSANGGKPGPAGPPGGFPGPRASR